MPFTALKGYTTPTAGSLAGTWGAGDPINSLNSGLQGVLDLNMAGVVSNSVASSNVTLSATDCQNCLFRFIGTLLANIVVSPAGGALLNGFYYFENYTSGNFTLTFTTGSGSVVLPQSRAGVMFIDATSGPRILSIVGKTNADPIPVGTVMMFYQASVPVGWSSVAVNDFALKIVSNGSGGVTSGSVVYSTLFGRTATDGYTLLTADIPSHTHSSGTYLWGAIQGLFSQQPGQYVGTSNTINTNALTQATGGGGAHSHAIDMRVQTLALVMGSKN